MISPEALRMIRTHAEQCYPREACGFITQLGVMLCDNVHPAPARNFEISGSDHRQAERHGILGMYHSHCDAPATPSGADVDRAQYFPYLIVEVRGGAAVHVNAYALRTEPRRRLDLVQC